MPSTTLPHESEAPRRNKTSSLLQASYHLAVVGTTLGPSEVLSEHWRKEGESLDPFKYSPQPDASHLSKCGTPTVHHNDKAHNSISRTSFQTQTHRMIIFLPLERQRGRRGRGTEESS